MGIIETSIIGCFFTAIAFGALLWKAPYSMALAITKHIFITDLCSFIGGFGLIALMGPTVSGFIMVMMLGVTISGFLSLNKRYRFFEKSLVRSLESTISDCHRRENTATTQKELDQAMKQRHRLETWVEKAQKQAGVA